MSSVILPGITDNSGWDGNQHLGDPTTDGMCSAARRVLSARRMSSLAMSRLNATDS